MRTLMFAVTLVCMGCSFTPPHGTPLTWYDERWGGVTEQELDNSCGMASLRTVMHFYFGHAVSERDLMQQYLQTQSEEVIVRAMKEGVSLLELEQLASTFGYQTRRSMLSIEELARVVAFTPVIVYLEVEGFRHFVVVRGMSDAEVLLADSSRGNVRYSREAFMTEWKVPDEYNGRWHTPGGLVLFQRESGPTVLMKFLRTPDSRAPESLLSLKRTMILGR